MKIKSLEAVGFKSFVDRLHVAFPPGITVIVGPNGCGKSNIVDSILWAIGERSAKHLRGKQMEDVIFNGADGRKPLGMAEVSLTFANDGGLAPPQYAEYGEITVTRRLYRSGESEYLINKVPCRLRDITDLFLDTGIGVNGYSIIEQGRVERLIHSNTQDRRLLIEEAAGVARYKERKRLALMKMEAAQQNLVRIQDVIAEVKRQIASLEKQVKRAEEFRGIRKEVREIELKFALREFAELSERAESGRGYLLALREREAGISGRTAEREAVIEEMRLSGMKDEEALRLLQGEVFELARKAQKMEGEIEFARREGVTLRDQEAQSIEEVREAFLGWRGAHRDRRGALAGRAELAEERFRKAEELSGLQARFNASRSRYQSLLDRSEEEKGRLIDTLTRLTSLGNRVTYTEERRQDMEKRIHANREESQKVSESLSGLEETFSQMTRDREAALGEQSTLREEKVRWEKENEILKESFRQRQAERIDVEEALRRDRSRALSLKELQEKFEGYEAGVKSLLLRKKETPERWRGLLGTVADLLEPEPRYEVALGAVLGTRLQSLIVDGEATGRDAIFLLREGKLGRANFIPRGLREETAPPPAPGNGAPPPLLRFIRVREGYEPVARFLAGDVAVAESWEEAVRWAGGGAQEGAGYRVFVTLDGDVIERSGQLSGGSRDPGMNLLERHREMRELEKRVREEEARFGDLREEEEGLREEIGLKEVRIGQRARELQEKEITLLHRERDLEQTGKEIAQVRQKLEVLEFEMEQFEEEDDQLVREKEEASSQIELLEATRKEGEGQVQSIKTDVEELRAETERLGGAITERKVTLASVEEKLRGLEGEEARLAQAVRGFREQVGRKIRAIREAREKAAGLREKIDGTTRELESCLDAHRVKESDLVRIREKVEAYSNELRETEVSARYLRQELEEVRGKIYEAEIQVSEAQIKLQHLQETMQDRYGASLTLVGTSQDSLPVEEMTKRLEELKASMAGFGEVNLLAVEEYQELKARHDFLIEQQTDLQQALDALKKTIARISRTTTQRFVEAFHQVNEKFKEVFARLFRGGQASLLLEDESDPATSGVAIIAQPGGKKLQNIDLLSGGEKALVAIALLFGIFMIKPTPFCLLDEVDAPLDDANLARFTEMIREFSSTSQFIVISHNKKTMETGNTLYGITMPTPGVSTVVSVRFN